MILSWTRYFIFESCVFQTKNHWRVGVTTWVFLPVSQLSFSTYDYQALDSTQICKEQEQSEFTKFEVKW